MQHDKQTVSFDDLVSSNLQLNKTHVKKKNTFLTPILFIFLGLGGLIGSQIDNFTNQKTIPINTAKPTGMMIDKFSHTSLFQSGDGYIQVNRYLNTEKTHEPDDFKVFNLISTKNLTIINTSFSDEELDNFIEFQNFLKQPNEKNYTLLKNSVKNKYLSSENTKK